MIASLSDKNSEVYMRSEVRGFDGTRPVSFTDHSFRRARFVAGKLLVGVVLKHRSNRSTTVLQLPQEVA
jgi:hypothetical protein